MPERTPRLPPLLPAPRRAEPGPGGFRLRDSTPIVLPGLRPGATRAAEADLDSARTLRNWVRAACGVDLPIESHERTDGLGPHVALRREADLGDEYTLRVASDGVRLAGRGPAGLRYAVETLCQLVTPSGRLPGCSVDDAPDFALRGIMLDVSRGKVPRPETLRGLVDLCVRLKLNMLMLYTEHTFDFRRHPEIGAGASPLDARSLRELDAYAARRHVDLVPCLQSLGHMEKILSLPRYAPLDESGRAWTLSPADPRTYELLADLYDEYLPNFRSRWLNANCDEPFDLPSGRSRSREDELGPGGVYVEHVRRVRDLAAAHGRRTMIWGDVVHRHPERVPDLPRDLVMLDWWYEAELVDFDRVRVFAEQGIEFMVCPGTSSWNCLFPRIDVAERNVTAWADAGRRHAALGLVNTDWGDFGHYNLQGNSWLGYAWGAQQSWSGNAPRRDFDRAFSRVVLGDPSGDAARIYRELGAVHDVGFTLFNASPIQFLYFDDLASARAIAAARPRPLARCERRLRRVLARIESARERFTRERLTWEELRYAAAASLLAVRRADAGLDYLAWRRRPASLPAAGRRALARRLQSLADEQAALGRELARLWRARSELSEFDFTRRRLARAVRSLRAAARRLERNQPPKTPAPPLDHTLTTPEALGALAQEWRARYARSGAPRGRVQKGDGARR